MSKKEMMTNLENIAQNKIGLFSRKYLFRLLFVLSGAFLIIGNSCFNKTKLKNETTFQTVQLGKDYDCLAPDRSEIRFLSKMDHGSMVHCTLPPHKTSEAVKHKTVEEIWYILEGQGKIWRKNQAEEKIAALHPEVSITIPVGTSFQFKNTGRDSLKILIVTMPPWPGESEAEKIDPYWN